MITQANRQLVAKMQDLERQVRALHEQEDTAMQAMPSMTEMSDLDLDWWINSLPSGFYRTELRVERTRRANVGA
jgi:hypothetical protein